MAKRTIYQRLMFLALLGYFTTGCSDVQFQEIPIAKKGITANEEIPDPDVPADPSDPDDQDPDLPPNPEPVTAEQVFFQASGGGKLDLLIVVDNSDSMMMDHSDHKIRNMFRSFLSTLQGVDYRIGFTTTDMTTPTYFSKFPGWSGRLDVLEGTQLKFLTPQTPNKEALFAATIDREESVKCRQGGRKDGGPCGSNYEEPLKAIKTFIDLRNADNAGFFRSDADFVSIVIADQDETPKSGTPTSAQSVIDHVRAAFNGTKKYTNYSVIVEPRDQACRRAQICSGPLGICLEGAEYGTYAAELARITSGRTASICSTNVSPDLEVIGKSVTAGGLVQEVTLQYEPVPGSVTVYFSPQSNIQYTVEGRAVKFSSKPAAGTKITVQYEHL